MLRCTPELPAQGTLGKPANGPPRLPASLPFQAPITDSVSEAEFPEPHFHVHTAYPGVPAVAQQECGISGALGRRFHPPPGTVG